MPQAWQCLMVLCLTLGLLMLVESAVLSPGKFQYDPDAMGLDENTPFTTEVKRSFRPVPFPCNGYDNIPRCQHNGKGPRKTLTSSGRFCVCLCPSGWIGPECGYAANSLPGRRSFPWNWQHKDERKRIYARDIIDGIYN